MNIGDSSEELCRDRDKNGIHLRNTSLALLSAYLYIIADGMALSYTSPATVDMKEPGSRLQNITDEQITWIVSLLNISSGMGNCFSGYATEKFGRRAVLIVLSAPYTLSWLMIAYAPKLPWIYCGRLLQGFCFGASSIAVTSYIVEISPMNVRGLLTLSAKLALILGMLIVMCLGYVLRWSWMAVTGGSVVLLATCILYFMPESPVWLLSNSSTDEATKAIRFLLGDDANIEIELQTMLETSTTEPKKFWKDFTNPVIYKPILIAVLLMLFCQASGITTMSSYTVDIFNNVGSSVDSLTSAVIFATVQLISTIFSGMLIEKVGRRILFIISGLLMFISLAVLSIYMALPVLGVPFMDLKWIPLAGLISYIGFFSIGFGSVPIVIIAELVPAHNRTVILAISVVSASIFSFIVTKSYTSLIENVGYSGLFLIYGIFALLGMLFGIFFLPETKGKTIAEISQSFGSCKNTE